MRDPIASRQVGAASDRLGSDTAALSRRGFLATAATAAGVLVVPFHLPGAADAAATTKREFAPNAYVRVGTDGLVTIVVGLVEMGQGSFTAIPMLIAEELDVDMANVRVEQAPADEKRYGHPLYGLQITGGSASIQAAWAKLRTVGAVTRSMLVTAAAQSLKVPASECVTERGVVRHVPSGRSVAYGTLVGRASALPVPADVPLKDPARFRLVGTPAKRLDTPSKVDGTAVFGIDVKLKGMKVAAIANCPFMGGTVGSVDDSKAKAISGVRRVLVSETAVAVVADHYGAAKKGLNALIVDWKQGASADFSSKVWGDQLATALKGKGVITVNEGSVGGSIPSGHKRHEAVYESPPLAHATMEPLNCTIHVRKDGCELWLGTQAPARAQAMVAQVTGLPPEKVVVHNHVLGGGFGRKLDVDYVVVAAQLARQVDFPLKVVYSREEDIQHDVYRPYFRDEMAAVVDDKGEPTEFVHRFAGSAVIARYAPMWLKDGLDTDAVHSAESPYDVANKYVEFVRHEPPAGLTTGNWRGVGPTHHAFPNECFIDELAATAKADPIAYRERLLAKNPRALAVLRLAAAKAGWGTAMAAGRGRGVSVVDAWDSYAALVTDITVGKDGSIHLDRMVCAVDCGVAVNPDGVETQIQGGIVYGLSAALYGTLTFEGGRVVQGNFHDYQPLRIHEMPVLEVHRIGSSEKPGGVGEIGTAVVVPSLMNAIHSATGKRFRTFPVPADRLRTA